MKSLFRRFFHRFLDTGTDSSTLPRATRRDKTRQRPTIKPQLECLGERMVPAVIDWLGGQVNTNWSNPQNWPGGVLPTAQDTIRYSANTTGMSVLDAGFGPNSVQGIIIDAGSNITLTLQKDLTLTGNAAQSAGNQLGGTITGQSNLIIAAGTNFIWGGGTMSGDPTTISDQTIVQVGATLRINSASGKSFSGRDIINNGQVIWNDSGSLSAGTGGHFMNMANSMFTIATTAPAGGSPVLFTSTDAVGTFINFGPDTQLIKQNANVVDFNINTYGSPAITIQAGELRLSQALSLQLGTITTQIPSAQLILLGNDPANVVSQTTISGAGKTLLVGTAQFSNVDVNGNLEVGSVGTVSGAGEITVANGGTLNVHGGTLSGGGRTLIQMGGQMRITLGATFTNWDITNQGLITWENALTNEIRYASGTFDNDGTFDIQTDGNITRGVPAGPGVSFTNRGIIQKTQGGGWTNINPQFFENYGTLSLISGNMAFDTGILNYGLIDLGGRSLNIAGAMNSLVNMGEIMGPGTLNVATLENLSGLIDLGGAAGGILTLNGNYFSNGGEVRLRIGGVNAFDQFVVNGAANLNGGATMTVNLVGGYVPNAGQTFRIMTFNSHNGNFDIENLPAGSASTIGATFYEVAW